MFILRASTRPFLNRCDDAAARGLAEEVNLRFDELQMYIIEALTRLRYRAIRTTARGEMILLEDRLTLSSC